MRMSSTKPYETTQKHAYENVAFIQLKCQNPHSNGLRDVTLAISFSVKKSCYPQLERENGGLSMLFS